MSYPTENEVTEVKAVIRRDMQATNRKEIERLNKHFEGYLF